MDNLTAYAKAELTRAGMFDKDSDYGGMLGDAVLKMVEQFANEGHSGFSAGLAISLFEKVARFEPLTPLTGADDEWMEVGEGVFQNVRCSHVFKDQKRFDGQPYDLDARVFREPNGVCFTSSDSVMPITFPYAPKREYVDRPAPEPEAV